MARYNPENDPEFNPRSSQNFTNADNSAPLGNNESPYNPRPEQLFYGGYGAGADDDVNRARLKAVDQTQRGAYQTNLGGYNSAMRDFGQSRNMTMGSLYGLKAAADGEAPSRAEIAGGVAMDRSLQNQVAAAGTSRGGPANQAAAYRNAASQAAIQRAQMTQGIAAERAGEMATARGQLSQATLGAQSQDLGAANAGLGAAGLQQQSEIEQRRLNQQGSQFYESQGQHVRDAELEAALRRQQMADQRGQAHQQNKQQGDKADWEKTKDIIAMGAGAAEGAVKTGTALSDPAAKDMMTWGSLGPLQAGALGGAAAPTFAGAQGMASGSPTGELKAHSDFATRFQSNPGSGPSMTSDENTKVLAAPGTDDWERYGASAAKDGDPDWKRGGSTKTGGKKPGKADAFGSFFGGIKDAARNTTPSDMRGKDVMFSDPRAKEEAYNLGRAHQNELRVTGKPPAGGFEYDVPSDLPDKSINPEKIAAAKGPAPKQEAPSGKREPRKVESTRRDALIIDKPQTADTMTASRPWRSEGDERVASAPPPAKAAAQSASPPPAKESEDPAWLTHPATQALAAGIMGPAQTIAHNLYMRKQMGQPMFSDERAKNKLGAPDEAMADAARSMEPGVYAYKDQYRPPEQKPGEVNVGPMANKMAADPVARTAIVRDPETDLLAIDKDKGLKVVMGSLASMQHQLDQLQGDVPDADGAKKARRRGDPSRSAA